MNRLDYTQLLEDIQNDLAMPGGNFEGLFGKDGATAREKELIAAIALVAADRLYSRLTKDAFLQRELEEHRGD